MTSVFFISTVLYLQFFVCFCQDWDLFHVNSSLKSALDEYGIATVITDCYSEAVLISPHSNNTEEWTDDEINQYLRANTCPGEVVFMAAAFKRQKTLDKPWHAVLQDLIQKNPYADSDQKMEVTVKDIRIIDVYLDMYYYKPYVRTEIVLQWEDQRFKMSDETKQILRDNFHSIPNPLLVPAKHGWHPAPTIVGTDAPGALSVSDDSKVMTLIGKNCTEDGVFTAAFLYQKLSYEHDYSGCSNNFQGFPSDVHTCSLDFYARAQTNIRFKIAEPAKYVSLKHASRMNVHMKWSLEPGSGFAKSVHNGAAFRLSYRFRRFTSTIFMETVLPLVIVTVLAWIIPMMVQWKLQLGVKLLAVLMYLYLFSELTESFKELTYGAETPRLVRCYSFYLIVTVLSGLVTLILYSMSLTDRQLPPPHLLSLYCTTISRLWCCGQIHNVEDNSRGEDRKYKREWSEVLQGINIVFMVLFCFVYIIGTLVIMWD